MNEFYYGAGRVRSLEARLLTTAQLERMAAAADFSGAFSVLSETPYAENLPKLKRPFDFEELLELETLSLKQLLDRLAPENIILTALFRKYDYLNLKIQIRGYFGQAEKFQLFSRAGTIGFDNLRLYVFEGINEINDNEIVAVIDTAKSSYKKQHDPQLLDMILDKHYFAYLKMACNLSPSPLIKNLANHQIDLINIKALVRARQLKKDKKFLQAVLLEPGLIGQDTLLDQLDKNLEDIGSRLSFTPYFPAIASGWSQLAENGSVFLLEKLMDDFIIEQFRKAKYLNSGLEPLVGFFLAKEAEIKTLRFILVSKNNYVGSEQIKARLRVNYA
ncbi:MAG: V-type ATPase subunit [Candidatus Margulisiibacteriota bacterium]